MEGATYKKFPPLKWAQRADCVLITIEIPDCEKTSIDINEEIYQLFFFRISKLKRV